MNYVWPVVYILIALFLVYLLAFGLVTLIDAVWLWRWLHPPHHYGFPI